MEVKEEEVGIEVLPRVGIVLYRVIGCVGIAYNWQENICGVADIAIVWKYSENVIVEVIEIGPSISIVNVLVVYAQTVALKLV